MLTENDAVIESAPKFRPVHKKIKVTVVIVIGFLYLFAAVLLIRAYSKNHTTVYLGNDKINVLVASTPIEQTQGLSGTSKLNSNSGMLFVFSTNNAYGFWMKDMNYSLDIIWISDDKKVNTIDGNLSPSTYPKVFYPNRPSKYVLEVDAGTAQRLGIHDGTSVRF